MKTRSGRNLGPLTRDRDAAGVHRGRLLRDDRSSTNSGPTNRPVEPPPGAPARTGRASAALPHRRPGAPADASLRPAAVRAERWLVGPPPQRDRALRPPASSRGRGTAGARRSSGPISRELARGLLRCRFAMAACRRLRFELGTSTRLRPTETATGQLLSRSGSAPPGRSVRDGLKRQPSVAGRLKGDDCRRAQEIDFDLRADPSTFGAIGVPPFFRTPQRLR